MLGSTRIPGDRPRLSQRPGPTLYRAFTVVAVGVSLAVNSAWMIGGVPLALGAVWWVTVLGEERYLESKFGETYLAYKRRVPRWFLFI